MNRALRIAAVCLLAAALAAPVDASAACRLSRSGDASCPPGAPRGPINMNFVDPEPPEVNIASPPRVSERLKIEYERRKKAVEDSRKRTFGEKEMKSAMEFYEDLVRNPPKVQQSDWMRNDRPEPAF